MPSAVNSRSAVRAKASRYSPKPARLSHWRTRPFAGGALPSFRVSTEATDIVNPSAFENVRRTRVRRSVDLARRG